MEAHRRRLEARWSMAARRPDEARRRDGGRGAVKSQARCGRSRGDEAALGARGRGEGAAPVLRRRRRQEIDVLGQRGEAKPGGSKRAPVAGWRCGGDEEDAAGEGVGSEQEEGGVWGSPLPGAMHASM